MRTATSQNRSRMDRLVTAIQFLSLVRSLPELTAIVRTAARALLDADGATFVLRENGMCHYADEDAIEPLWKGQRFPMESCISGWTMLNRKAAAIPDIYQDPRIPHDAYRPTFVRSLIMVPIRTVDPVGAIGFYWADRHTATEAEIMLAQALADSTAVAMENLRLGQSAAQTAPPAPQPPETAAQPANNLVRICSWTGRIEHEGEWLSVEKYLEKRLGVAVTHGMSGDVLKMLMAELQPVKPK